MRRSATSSNPTSAYACSVFSPFVIEDDGRHLHIQVALDEPLRVRWAEVILEEQRLGLRVLFQPDDAVAVDAVLGIPSAVAGAGVHDAAAADRGPGSPPHA